MSHSTHCLIFAILSLALFCLGLYFMTGAESIPEMFNYLLTAGAFGMLYAVWLYVGMLWRKLERGERRVKREAEEAT